MTEQVTLKLKPVSNKQEKLFVNTMMYCLAAPIIVWPSMEETLTADMTAKVKMYRLADAAKKGELYECTDYEASLYLSCASLANPLSYTWTKLYVHVFMKCFPDRTEIQEGIQTPDEWELQDLTRLKQWIFRKQIEEMKLREKQREKKTGSVVARSYQQLTLS